MSLYKGTNLIAGNPNSANPDLSNITNVATTKIAHDAMPSGTYLGLSFGASGSTYVMPADGWLFLDKALTGNLQYVVMNNHTAHFVLGSAPSGTNSSFLLMPVSKGDNVEISYTAMGAVSTFHFIYANGSAWEA